MEIIGYYEEYYRDKKYLGRIECKMQKNRTIGYAGMKTFIAISQIKLGKNTIKVGDQYRTIYYPLNGRY
jgi:hypothetical protein